MKIFVFFILFVVSLCVLFVVVYVEVDNQCNIQFYGFISYQYGDLMVIMQDGDIVFIILVYELFIDGDKVDLFDEE